MDKQKKSLLCMYVDDFCGIKKESFNFNIEKRYMIKKSKISTKSDDEIKGFPKNFWGDNVSAVTLIVGENGAGKTMLMRLLIKWLCQLSAGHIPQEKGALVIGVADKDKDKNQDRLIAFDNGKLWTIEIHKNEKIMCIEDIDEIKRLLSDIRLAYYTDTMTDLELSDMLTAEELTFLQDDSLLTRLSNSMKNGYTVESVKDCMKRDDFKRQMELFMHCKEIPNNMPEFPLRYMKFTARNVGDEKSFEKILDGNNSLIGEMIDFWNKVFASDAEHDPLAIVKALLWGIFIGTIRSLIQWERTLPNLGNSIVAELVKSSIVAYIRIEYNDWNIVFKNFFTNLFSDCKNRFLGVQHDEEFRDKWEKQQIEDKINSFLDTLRKLENGEFLERWTSFENTQNMWEFKLEYFYEIDENKLPIMIQEWKDLWEHYLTVAHLMPGCRFDWLCPSSGEINKANLYCTMRVVDVSKYDNMWFLLDEPDNTFHPDWKRSAISELLNICSNYNLNFQMLISTHSPIMLSDVPKQAVILLKTCKGVKQQVTLESSPFGQQIYTLFKDGFFMKHGVIGAFANKKIKTIYSELLKLEKKLKRNNKISENRLSKYKEELKDRECIINLIDEPLLRGHLAQSYDWCSKRCIYKESLLYKKK